MKKLTIGILAHVDAGKTTLSEALMYQSGGIRKLGRVDHGDAFLDTFALERERGITIFSKQASLKFDQYDLELILLDTPGHTDFAAEMERTLQVLDYAVLVISAADGVQSHTETLWELLGRYQVPVFLFVNKMDQPGTDRNRLAEQLSQRLDAGCIPMDQPLDDAAWDALAMCSEQAMEEYLEKGDVEKETIRKMTADRTLFPVCFGSALKLQGTDTLVRLLADYTMEPVRPEEFGARVFKISRDDQGKRLTWMKITGGSLKVRSTIGSSEKEAAGEDGQDAVKADPEKVDQIRVYSGAKYEAVQEAAAGDVCAVTGLTATYAGQGLGTQRTAWQPYLEPVLTYRITLPILCNTADALLKLRQLEEEIPELHILWNESAREIHAQVMGEVQIEILKRMIRDRYGLEVSFDTGSIVYKETIASPAAGAGHFEPLRHYAEVHLMLVPGEPGSGVQAESACSTDMLATNWQRLIMTHILEREHAGVLTGSSLTDVRVILTAGRSHPKHTEGGDFRQATYRAIRQALRKAENVLLEPWYRFRLEVPQENVGRAISDIQRMCGEFEGPETEGDHAVLTGRAPVSEMHSYQMELTAYSHGLGRLSCMVEGYAPCHNAQEVLAQTTYDPDTDVDNPCGSVFCSHGAGFVVDWSVADAYMHIQDRAIYGSAQEEMQEEAEEEIPVMTGMPSGGVDFKDRFHDEDELKAIFARTYGKDKEEESRSRWKRQHRTQENRVRSDRETGRPVKKEAPMKEYLLVDGYNIIYAWPELRVLSERDIGSARTKLMDELCNYQGFTRQTVILVFDAYRVEGHPGEIFKYHNIHVVFTKEAETADQYIEKTVREIGHTYKVTVATSDGLEQVIIMGEGAHRMSAADLKDEMKYVQEQIREIAQQKRLASGKQFLFDTLPGELARQMEEIRLGKKDDSPAGDD